MSGLPAFTVRDLLEVTAYAEPDRPLSVEVVMDEREPRPAEVLSILWDRQRRVLRIITDTPKETPR